MHSYLGKLLVSRIWMHRTISKNENTIIPEALILKNHNECARHD